MMSRPSTTRPPRLAVWLVDLFTPDAHSESTLGDLHEEFAGLVATSGVAAARRWFWRQTLKSIGHLTGAAFRSTPWSIFGGVLLGFLLRRVGLSNPGSVVDLILRAQQPYSNLHYHFYVWLVTWGMEIVGVIQSLLVGCAVAAVAKGREIIATITMVIVSAVLLALSFSLLLRRLPPNLPIPWPLLAFNLEGWIAILLGGVLVRKFRSLAANRFSEPSRSSN
jgi:hypothetical protein